MAMFYRAIRWEGGPGGSRTSEWWCDAFGPYEVLLDASSSGGFGSAGPSHGQPPAHRGVGPFLMRPREKLKDGFKLVCSQSRRKTDPCKATASLDSNGVFLLRRHFHNHGPELHLPQPASPHLRLPPPPSFEEAAATLAPPLGPMKKVLEEYDTTMLIFDETKQEMIETPITMENYMGIVKNVKMEEVDGKRVFRCPVPSCHHQFGFRPNLYAHMRLHMRGRRMASIQAPEKLCPLCRVDMVTHEALVRHIVDDHDTRLECTEHEFETYEAFKKWKIRTEQEDTSTFTMHMGMTHSKSNAVFSCCRTGRKLTQDEYSMHTSYRKRLGVECPAAMVVKEADGRVTVTYWRTHIGHTPNILDVRLTADHKSWIKDLVEKGYRKRAIAAEAARNYFGQELSRSVIMDPETLKRILVVLNLNDSKGTIDVPIKHDPNNVDQIRLFLVQMIRDGLERLGSLETELQHLPKEHAIDDHKTVPMDNMRMLRHDPTGHIHMNRLSNEVDRKTVENKYQYTTVVYPRKSPHETCEQLCQDCGVCVHRYGCTCIKFMYDDKMCKHIHTVALREGCPGPDWVDPFLTEDTVGLQEALRRLHRLNHRERLKGVLPIAEEIVSLLKVDRKVDLNQVEEHLRAAVILLRAGTPLQSTRDDDVMNVKSLKAFRARHIADRTWGKDDPDFTVLFNAGKPIKPRKEELLDEVQLKKEPGLLPSQRATISPVTPAQVMAVHRIAGIGRGRGKKRTYPEPDGLVLAGSAQGTTANLPPRLPQHDNLSNESPNSSQTSDRPRLRSSARILNSTPSSKSATTTSSRLIPSAASSTTPANAEAGAITTKLEKVDGDSDLVQSPPHRLMAPPTKTKVVKTVVRPMKIPQPDGTFRLVYVKSTNSSPVRICAPPRPVAGAGAPGMPTIRPRLMTSAARLKITKISAIKSAPRVVVFANGQPLKPISLASSLESAEHPRVRRVEAPAEINAPDPSDEVRDDAGRHSTSRNGAQRSSDAPLGFYVPASSEHGSERAIEMGGVSGGSNKDVGDRPAEDDVQLKSPLQLVADIVKQEIDAESF
ncbi:hypothetical protein BIW11_04440 [Tropilaelaps mercedesae]|uniref:C2H2-type domain-containing protein n=1 Tax=Tropilaelaps mercedesae TaxID=418985 RepID=A0A1V9X6S6_9ACAR|nr:hypothetical protein BIW11_04440 [Tropilaelaps mercedesae]